MRHSRKNASELNQIDKVKRDLARDPSGCGVPNFAAAYNVWSGDTTGWILATPKTARAPVPHNPGKGRNRKAVTV
jgi:hypothetical protein